MNKNYPRNNNANTEYRWYINTINRKNQKIVLYLILKYKICLNKIISKILKVWIELKS